MNVEIPMEIHSDEKGYLDRLKQRVSLLVFHQAQHLKPLRYFQRDLRIRVRLSLHFSLIQVRDIFQQHFSRTNFLNIQNRKRADSQAS